jgi:hypothetical protein
MSTEAFSPEESLRVIQTMINKTRQQISGQSHYFLMWGWCTLAACIGQFLLMQVFHYEKHYLVWLITIPCVLFTIWFSTREVKNKKVKTYAAENMSYLWTGIGISFFVVSMIFSKIGWVNCYPFYIMFYGLGSFVSGRILRFTPLVVGGAVNWGLALAAIWAPFGYQPLFAAAALLFSYIIPGHLLRSTQREIQ